MARFLYVQTAGRERPERCFTVFFMATAARAMDHEAQIVFTQSGLSMFEPGFAQATGALDGSKRTLADFIRMAVDNDVTLYGCRLSLPLCKLQPEEVEWPMRWIGAADLHDLLLDADRAVFLS